jgi:hypothetical protein
MKGVRPVAAVLASLANLAAAPAFAADDPGVIPLEIVVGQVTLVSSGPVNRVICDDPGLVQPVFTDAGPGLKGMSTGTTTCSLTDTLSMRRVFRVVVVASPSARPPGPQGAGKAGSGG